MLADSDLSEFRNHFHKARNLTNPTADAIDRLTDENGLFPEELWQLASSLEIASVAGDAEFAESLAAAHLAQALKQISVRCLDIRSEAWVPAIAWIINQPGFAEEANGSASERSKQVGNACRRLRNYGYDVTVTANGPDISEHSQRELFARIDSLAAHIGGWHLLKNICAVVSKTELIYDGQWMFGDRLPGALGTARQAVPIGWLFSLALRHAYVGRSPKILRNPKAPWERLLDLTINFAAVLDCQRYNQFEDLHPHPVSALKTFRDAMLWRELFSLPQVPRQVINALRVALFDELSREELNLFDWSPSEAFSELENLLKYARDNDVISLRRQDVARAFPTLVKFGLAIGTAVNGAYSRPTYGGLRNQSDFIFFSYDRENVFILPASFLREAFCRVLFLQIWKKLPKGRASKAVGKIFEKSIYNACAGKGDHVERNVKYKIGRSDFEIDVAVRQGGTIILIETKSKSLTEASRSGDLFAFYEDYSDSYLALVKQLVRHEKYLRAGQTPIQLPSSPEGDQILKVAVSPLSFGPTTDKALSNSLLRSFAGVKIHSLSGSKREAEIANKFNSAIGDINEIVDDIALRNPDGSIDRFGYCLDLFWLDFGEILYSLDRAKTVFDALRPLKHITFASRDFWTELAFADKQGLLASWHPPMKATDI